MPASAARGRPSAATPLSTSSASRASTPTPTTAPATAPAGKATSYSRGANSTARPKLSGSSVNNKNKNNNNSSNSDRRGNNANGIKKNFESGSGVVHLTPRAATEMRRMQARTGARNSMNGSAVSYSSEQQQQQHASAFGDYLDQLLEAERMAATAAQKAERQAQRKREKQQQMLQQQQQQQRQQQPSKSLTGGKKGLAALSKFAPPSSSPTKSSTSFLAGKRTAWAVPLQSKPAIASSSLATSPPPVFSTSSSSSADAASSVASGVSGSTAKRPTTDKKAARGLVRGGMEAASATVQPGARKPTEISSGSSAVPGTAATALNEWPELRTAHSRSAIDSSAAAGRIWGASLDRKPTAGIAKKTVSAMPIGHQKKRTVAVMRVGPAKLAAPSVKNVRSSPKSVNPNPLDSTALQKRRGRERTTKKVRKPTHMKKLVLLERAQRFLERHEDKVWDDVVRRKPPTEGIAVATVPVDADGIDPELVGDLLEAEGCAKHSNAQVDADASSERDDDSLHADQNEQNYKNFTGIEAPSTDIAVSRTDSNVEANAAIEGDKVSKRVENGMADTSASEQLLQTPFSTEKSESETVDVADEKLGPGEMPARVSFTPDNVRALKHLPKLTAVRDVREYCNQKITAQLNTAVVKVLKDLQQFYARWKERELTRAHATGSDVPQEKLMFKKRIVMGLNEVTRAVTRGRAKAVIIPPNLEHIGGLDDATSQLLRECRRRNVHIIFALRRHTLARAVAHRAVRQMSAVAILDPSGTDEAYQRMLELAKQGRRDFEREADARRRQAVGTETTSANNGTNTGGADGTVDSKQPDAQPPTPIRQAKQAGSTAAARMRERTGLPKQSGEPSPALFSKESAREGEIDARHLPLDSSVQTFDATCNFAVDNAATAKTETSIATDAIPETRTATVAKAASVSPTTPATTDICATAKAQLAPTTSVTGEAKATLEPPFAAKRMKATAPEFVPSFAKP